jgi:hypothetical protein
VVVLPPLDLKVVVKVVVTVVVAAVTPVATNHHQVI